MKKLSAIFRCDATQTLGGGHVMRCLTLADVFAEKGWECIFSVCEGTESVVSALTKSQYKIIPSAIPSDITADIMIIDSYLISEEEERDYRAVAPKIIVIDDCANRRHDCDILIDQTYNRHAEDYLPYTQDGCTILAGSNYAMLRPQFAMLRDQSLKAREIRNGQIDNILISIGSTDPHNTASVILNGLRKTGKKIDIVIGKGCPHRQAQIDLIDQMNSEGESVHYHEDITDMATLMAQSDLAFGAGGTTSWERCALGLPSIIVEIADNQKTIAKNLSEAGACINLGSHVDLQPSDISQLMYGLDGSYDRIRDISIKSAQICDGKGASRAYDAITTVILQIRPCSMDDALTLYELRTQKSAMSASYNSDNFSYESHLMWLEQALNSALKCIFIVYIGEHLIGSIRYDIDTAHAIVSVVLSDEMKKKGFGPKIINQANMRLKSEHEQIQEIRAYIKDNNNASKRAFAKAGFTETGDHFSYSYNDRDNEHHG